MPPAGDSGPALVVDAEPVYALGAVAALAEAGIVARAVPPAALPVARPMAAVVLDSRLGDQTYARDVVDELRARNPEVAVVVVVDRPRPVGIVAAMEAGARALVHRRCSPAELAAATRAALQGRDWLSAPLAALLRQALLAEATGQPAGELTAREADVLRALAAGGSNVEIGRRLGISEHTVRNHLHSLMGKLGVANRTDALATAARLGLVDLAD